MPNQNLDLSGLSWDEVRQYYPDIYRQYGPGSSGYVPGPNEAPPSSGGNPPAGTPPPVYQPPTIPQPTPPGYDPAYGGIPQVPNPVHVAGDVTQGNLTNLPGMEDLTHQTNQFNTREALNPYIANLPGYQGMVGQQSQNTLAELQGHLPPDVIAQLAQRAAERGVATGSPESPNSTAAYLRALGLTSLDLTQRGGNDLSRQIHDTPVPPQYMLQSGFVTPQQQYDAYLASALYASAPNPAAAAAAARNAALAGLRAGQGTVGGGGVTGGGGGVSGISPFRNNGGISYGGPPTVVRGSGVDPGGPRPPGLAPGYGSNGGGTAVPGSSGGGFYGAGSGETSTGGLQWQWDSTIGGFVNTATGEISDTPNNRGSWGITYDQVNAPAQNDPNYVDPSWYYQAGSGQPGNAVPPGSTYDPGTASYYDDQTGYFYDEGSDSYYDPYGDEWIDAADMPAAE